MQINPSCFLNSTNYHSIIDYARRLSKIQDYSYKELFSLVDILYKLQIIKLLKSNRYKNNVIGSNLYDILYVEFMSKYFVWRNVQ